MHRTFESLIAAAVRLRESRIVVAAAHDPDAIEAIKKAESIGLARGILVGDAQKIRIAAEQSGFEVDTARVVNEPDDILAAQRAISIIRGGEADLLMKGKISTAMLIRAILDRDNGLRAGRLLSQVIVFSVPATERLMLMSDAAITIAPTLEQKAEICRNAIEVAHAIGIERPNVALLCALEIVNPEMPATIDAAALTLMNRRGQISGAFLEGPLALDVALSSFAAQRKGIESPLVENCDIFIPPDIEAANILYRAICYLANGESGGIVFGARVPVILLSRAETPETKLRSIAIAKLVEEATRLATA